MLAENKQKLISVFKNNMDNYIGYDDIQETITSIIYLYWNARYNYKLNLTAIENNNCLIDYLFSNIKNYYTDKILKSSNLMDNLKKCKLYNIFSYLNDFSDESDIKEMICEDYNSNSRYNPSTPLSVSELVYEILESTTGNDVLDLGSCSGNFLSYYAKNKKDYNYTGVEINYKNSFISELKLDSLNAKFAIFNDNIFQSNVNDEKYDKIFCNQPFNIKLTDKDIYELNIDNKKINVEYNKRMTSDWAFIYKVINSLTNSGKGVIIVPNGLLYKMPDKEIRRALIEERYIEAVISLPGKLFYNTGIESTLLVLSNNNDKIKFIDAKKMYINDKFTNSLDVNNILNEYFSKKDTKESFFIEINEINDAYSLNIDSYKKTENIEINNPKKLSDVTEEIIRGYQLMSNELNLYLEKKDNLNIYKIININNIIDGNLDTNLTEIYYDGNKFNKYLLQDKDLIISSKGVTSKIAIIDVTNEKYIPSGNFTIIRTKKDELNPYYLKMFFESIKGEKILNSIKSGGILPVINLSMLRDMNVPVPSIEKQEKMVSKFLAKKDEINILKLKLKKAEDLLKDFTNGEF